MDFTDKKMEKSEMDGLKMYTSSGQGYVRDLFNIKFFIKPKVLKNLKS